MTRVAGMDRANQMNSATKKGITYLLSAVRSKCFSEIRMPICISPIRLWAKPPGGYQAPKTWATYTLPSLP